MVSRKGINKYEKGIKPLFGLSLEKARKGVDFRARRKVRNDHI